jgi:hypothetical protein
VKVNGLGVAVLVLTLTGCQSPANPCARLEEVFLRELSSLRHIDSTVGNGQATTFYLSRDVEGSRRYRFTVVGQSHSLTSQA